MKLNMELCSLVADIEQIIGSECYNPNSYDGWNNLEGCEFRYPISIRTQSGDFTKVKTNINTTPLLSKEDITPESIKYMKYKFGSNELFIGLGIIKALEFLERTYGLDFNELKKQQNRSTTTKRP